MKMQKTAIAGCGAAGTAAATILCERGLGSELVLMDPDLLRARKTVGDLQTASVCCPSRIRIQYGDWRDLKDCDILLFCPDSPETEDLNAFGEKVKKSGFDGILICVTEEADRVAARMAACTGLDQGHVLGVSPQSARLKNALALAARVDPKSITAWVLGGSGDAACIPWSTVSLAGIPLEDLLEDDRFLTLQKTDLEESVREPDGPVTLAAAAVQLMEAIFHDEKSILPVCVELNGAYGEFDVFAGVPCVIGKEGAEQVAEIPLYQAEMQEFHTCCEILRRNGGQEE